MKPTTHKNPNSGAKDDKKMTKQQLTKQKVRNTLNKSNKKSSNGYLNYQEKLTLMFMGGATKTRK